MSPEAEQVRRLRIVLLAVLLAESTMTRERLIELLKAAKALDAQTQPDTD